MEKMIFYVSDCCGVESDSDICVCSRCGEHCEIVSDDSLDRDYIPGYDDGEWWYPIVGVDGIKKFDIIVAREREKENEDS